jgi:hypothetical protein
MPFFVGASLKAIRHDMTISPQSSFEITSDALCFGSRAEVKEGVSHPVQTPTCVPFEDTNAGTVLNHVYKYNFQALSGTWNVYLLKEPSGISDGGLLLSLLLAAFGRSLAHSAGGQLSLRTRQRHPRQHPPNVGGMCARRQQIGLGRRLL